MTAELTNKHDPEFRSFWESRHPLSFEKIGFDPDLPLHRVWCEWDANGKIISAAVFVPVIRGEKFLGHQVYLASHRKSKALITFSHKVMEGLRSDPAFGLLSIETHQSKSLACIDKLAMFLGAVPVRFPGMDYYDYLWDSKERSA